MLNRLLLCCVAAILLSHSAVADPQHLGDGVPQPAGSDVAGPEVSGLDTVAFDELPGKAISATLQQATASPETPAMRGRKEIELYRNAASAVVLVLTKDGIGSGIHIGGGQIVTNWHVIRSFQTAAVLFKPEVEGAKINPNAVLRADVIKVDQLRDLALLKVASVPSYATTLEFGAESEIQIGADVHAIGHPTGQIWTYTRGLISQVRLDYQWKAEKSTHRADVIQTQTPINPGNSGGPLIGDSGKLLGVNSFKGEGEGMNFAVSVKDVASFIASPESRVSLPESRPEAQNSKCKPVVLFDGRDKDNTGRLRRIDMTCDGKADAFFVLPDDPRKPYQLLLDMNGDGKIDISIEDTDRDGKWDVSYYDTNFDGKIDLIGYHPDGDVKASRFEKYASR